ncbi:MAG: tetratricopeptide repeat protein [Ignavibacteria bacterium]|nr:tetratricopeptide repeat protein [Ignavibacteria bacterium]
MRNFHIFLLFALLSCLAKSQDISAAKKYIESGKLKEAKPILETLIGMDKNNHEAHYYLGKIFFLQKDGEKAAEQFEKAIELNPKNSDYHCLLGQAYGMDAQNSSIFTQIKLAPKIKREFQTAVDLNPKNVAARKGLITYYLRAPGIMGGSNDKALAEAKTLVSIDEKSGRIVLATIYLEQNNFSAAENECKQLEAKFGNQKDFSSFYNDYGYMLLKQKRYDEAIQKFQKQISLNPENANAYDSLGDGYKAAGKKNEAIAAYKKALQLDPNFEASKKNLSELQK